MAEKGVIDGEPSDSDIFEIDDFTTASEWEKFISRIEEILGPHGWMLDNCGRKSCGSSQLNRLSTHDQNDSGSTHTDEVVEQWQVKHDFLKIESFQFILSHHKLLQQLSPEPTNASADSLPQALKDSMDLYYNFSAHGHCVSKWFGVKDFLLLTPKDRNKIILSLSQINLIWSSIGIALSNLKCTLPMFFQIKELDRQLYYGMCIANGFRTAYEMIQLSYKPNNCTHVQGMIEAFTAKIGVPITSDITVSIRFIYIIKDWNEEFCKPGPDTRFDNATDESCLRKLPFGPLDDPVQELQLAACWPCLTSDVFVDDAHYSDLQLEQASQWRLRVRYAEKTRSLLHGHLWTFLRLCRQSSLTTTQIIRSLTEDENENQELSGDVTQVLNRLTDTVPSLTKPLTTVVSHATRKVIKTNLIDAPIPDDVLNTLFEILFPDAQKTEEEACIIQGKLDDHQKHLECESVRSKDKYRHLKSAPVDSLTYMLSICICMLNYSHGGIHAVAQLWHEMVLELRFRFDNNIILPRLAQTFPNLNYCLIHQKLQMLNYCILKRQQKNKDISNSSVQRTQSSSSAQTSVSHKDYEKNNVYKTLTSSTTSNFSVKRDRSWGELLTNINRGSTESENHFEVSDDSEDEFYETCEEFNITEDSNMIIDDKLQEPQGVLHETEMNLLETGKVLCIPITQETQPLTEDMLLEQQNALFELGTSEEATRMRAQMQSASLLSDMESFKAANPGCILEDFVRWYSPNDWVEGPEKDEEKEELSRFIEKRRNLEMHSSKEDDGKNAGWEVELDDDIETQLLLNPPAWSAQGHLSLRMRVPGNMWQEVWTSAKPIPARLQKRLFDDTKEGEKVLHFLKNLSPSEVALNLFPVLFHASLHSIDQEEDSSDLATMLNNIVKNVSKIFSPSAENLPIIEDIINQLHAVEVSMLRVKSLRSKFHRTDEPQENEDEEIESFIRDLLRTNDLLMKGGPNCRLRKLLIRLLQEQKREDEANHLPPLKVDQDDIRMKQLHKDSLFPLPSSREYILRTIVSKPSVSSRPSPQRLYTIITKGEFRMAGSFTEDTSFL